MSRRKEAPQPESQFEKNAQKQYERCMVDSAEIIEYKQRKDLSIDEIAELRCKTLACRLQMCMSKPKTTKAIHRDVYSGEYYSLNDPCVNAHSDFLSCVESEKKGLASEQKII